MSHQGTYYKTRELYQTRHSLPPSSLLREPFHKTPVEQQKPKPKPKPSMKVHYETKRHVNSGDPEVWGPAFWFSLHNGAARYPKKASPLWAQRMKHFILGIPVTVPCEKCSDHATAYIESKYDDLDRIVQGRDTLFPFLVDFHNYVNRRYDKTEMSLQEAERMYMGEADVLTVRFGPV